LTSKTFRIILIVASKTFWRRPSRLDVMPVTLRDIARRLGISVTTVSRALAGYGDVAETTRQRVRQAAEEMGYYPNVTARQLQKQRTDTLAFVIPTFGPRFSDPYFSELLAGIGNEAGQHGFDLLVSTQPPDSDAEREAYRRIVHGRRSDGALVVRTRQQDERIRFLAEHRFPFVAFGRTDLDLDFVYVDEDSYHGLELLTQHLIDLGHRRIGFIAAPADLMFCRYRLDGFRQTLEANGSAPDPRLIVAGDLTQSGGYRAAQELLALEPRPTAIIACNDLMALGAMSAAQEKGLAVGRDLSVGGFDDIPLCEHSHPPLTTVRQPVYQIGRRITHMLIQLARGQAPVKRQVLLIPELVVRESTGRPAGA
jgi:LacI family transcriptional regulator